MSIYTYESAKKFCEILNIEFRESSAVSDQELQELFSSTEQCSLANTDYVSGLVWITNGKENCYIEPKEEVPVGWRLGRTMNHASKKNPGLWSEICSKSAQKQWVNNQERREDFSRKLRDKWEKNYDSMAEKARVNGKHGMFGKLHPRALLLEYNGLYYYGWRELKEATGVTKDLYKKYYLNGINPTPRIGKNGPTPSTSTVVKDHQGRLS